jgi:hypothetical protein
MRNTGSLWTFLLQCGKITADNGASYCAGNFEGDA